jgi:hypothetical protein
VSSSRTRTTTCPSSSPGTQPSGSAPFTSTTTGRQRRSRPSSRGACFRRRSRVPLLPLLLLPLLLRALLLLLLLLLFLLPLPPLPLLLPPLPSQFTSRG